MRRVFAELPSPLPKCLYGISEGHASWAIWIGVSGSLVSRSAGLDVLYGRHLDVEHTCTVAQGDVPYTGQRLPGGDDEKIAVQREVMESTQ